MIPKIAPALTPDEWAEWRSADPDTGDNPDIVDEWTHHDPMQHAGSVDSGLE